MSQPAPAFATSPLRVVRAGQPWRSVTFMDDAGETLDVLLVEDDDLVRDCLSAALSEAGVGIAGSCSGEAALIVLRQARSPDVLVTDINLGPGMDGLAFARAARELHPGLPVVYISGRYGELRGLSRTERFLPKPFSAPALLRLIGEVIAARSPSA